MIETIKGVQLGQQIPSAPQHRGQESGQAGFGRLLQEKLEQTQGVAFSKHARERAEERGIEVTPDLLSRLSDSVERAQEKGATNILALDRSLAFIINVPHGRVITTMNQDEMKENIFTNIDGAVIL